MAKVKNVCVNIKIGKKEFTFKNLILDTLLCDYVNTLIYGSFPLKNLEICCIKFSELKNIAPSTFLQTNAFDITMDHIHGNNIKVEATPHRIIHTYTYYSENNSFYDPSKGEKVDISKYNGKKIYYLGFSDTPYRGGSIYAILDVSNYDIYMQDGEELKITRIDEVSTDAIFTSLHEKVQAPVHLYPDGIQGIFPLQVLWSKDHMSGMNIYNNAYAKLTNFGFGNTPNNIDIEYDIAGNYEINDNVFSIKNIWSPKGLYPSNDLYPSNEIFPDDHPYKYLILRFKLFQFVADDDATYENPSYVNKFTGAEYLQAIPIDKMGSVNFNIKYERG